MPEPLEGPSVKLSIIVATTGRPTLGDALASATGQMLPGDELILVFDDAGDAGDTPRNRVLDSATGTHVTFLDDDDEYRPGALEAMRRFARAHSGRIGIFRVNRGEYGAAWVEEHRRLVHSQTGMFLIPNVPGKVGRFGPWPGALPGRFGDFKFIVETVALQGEPVWCPEIVQEIRPEKRLLRRLRYRLRLGTRIRRALGMNARGGAVVTVPLYPEAERWAVRRTEELRAQQSVGI